MTPDRVAVPLAVGAGALFAGVLFYMSFVREPNAHGVITSVYRVAGDKGRRLLAEEAHRAGFGAWWHFNVLDETSGALLVRQRVAPLAFVGALGGQLWFDATTDASLGLHARAMDTFEVVVRERDWRGKNPGFTRVPNKLPWLNADPPGIGLLADDGQHLLLDVATLSLRPLANDSMTFPESATRLDRRDAGSSRVPIDERHSASLKGEERKTIHCESVRGANAGDNPQSFLDAAFIVPQSSRSVLSSEKMKARLATDPPLLLRHRLSLSSPLLQLTRTGCQDAPPLWTIALDATEVLAAFFEPTTALLIVRTPGDPGHAALQLELATGRIVWRTPL